MREERKSVERREERNKRGKGGVSERVGVGKASVEIRRGEVRGKDVRESEGKGCLHVKAKRGKVRGKGVCGSKEWGK